jgi:hypothetical protein
MPPKHVAPSITLRAFNCPNCGALADQSWFAVRADKMDDGKLPHLVTEEIVTQFETI